MTNRAFTFTGGTTGSYRVVRASAVVGEALPSVARIAVTSGILPATGERAAWFLRGVMSNERYVSRVDKERLASYAPTFGHAEATCAALIPIRKNDAWWALTQDERLAIFAERHVALGERIYPSLARRLHHCRDLGSDEPFDFLTWFEYAPSDEAAFDDLLAALRDTTEWQYVEREVDVRLVRD